MIKKKNFAHGLNIHFTVLSNTERALIHPIHWKRPVKVTPSTMFRPNPTKQITQFSRYSFQAVAQPPHTRPEKKLPLFLTRCFGSRMDYVSFARLTWPNSWPVDDEPPFRGPSTAKRRHVRCPARCLNRKKKGGKTKTAQWRLMSRRCPQRKDDKFIKGTITKR